ncbi:hypothetical protein HNP46_006040 [Pseudomonas nitritireducens]|uniref:Uncharacterized protein n=1 Tax=Pseudomonas nitroreducens TaxID=46680 RepID=A0A7W7KRA5_PSENT|nr:hypothetical protein [Pseudomonas nitritireducens]MBB4867129.1 hypothetical protein [Pseudomonas nitritireducens]
MNTEFILKILNICMTAGYGVWMYTIGEPGYAVVGIWAAGAMVYFRLQEYTTLPAQGSAYVETLRGKCTTPFGLRLLNCKRVKIGVLGA